MPSIKSPTRSTIPERVVVYGVDSAGVATELLSDSGGIVTKPDASTWSITATSDNAIATATKAAEAGKSHYITSIAGSYSAANIGLITVSDGAAVVGNYHTHNQRDVVLSRPFRAVSGNAVSVSLAASGTVGVIGAVTITGYTV